MGLIAQIMLTAALTCPKTKIVNQTNYKWNKFDQQSLNTAKKRCKELYKKSPCVKIFYKTQKMDYKVVCGAQEADTLTK
jgi:hypothetical protein